MECADAISILVVSSTTFQEKLSANIPSPKVCWNRFSVISLYYLLSSRIPIRSIAFHPHGPVLFICTGSHVHLYDLQRQILLKKLSTGTRALSCMAIHSGGIFVRRIINTGCQFSPMPFLGVHRGEHYRWWRRWKSFMVKTQILICQKGSNWYSFFALYFRFDLDLSTMPYKVLGSHASAVKVTYWHPFDIYIAMAWDWTNSLHRTLTFIQHILCLPRLLMMRLSTYFMEWSMLI